MVCMQCAVKFCHFLFIKTLESGDFWPVWLHTAGHRSGCVGTVVCDAGHVQHLLLWQCMQGLEHDGTAEGFQRNLCSALCHNVCPGEANAAKSLASWVYWKIPCGYLRAGLDGVCWQSHHHAVYQLRGAGEAYPGLWLCSSQVLPAWEWAEWSWEAILEMFPGFIDLASSFRRWGVVSQSVICFKFLELLDLGLKTLDLDLSTQTLQQVTHNWTMTGAGLQESVGPHCDEECNQRVAGPTSSISLCKLTVPSYSTLDSREPHDLGGCSKPWPERKIPRACRSSNALHISLSLTHVGIACEPAIPTTGLTFWLAVHATQLRRGWVYIISYSESEPARVKAFCKACSVQVSLGIVYVSYFILHNCILFFFADWPGADLRTGDSDLWAFVEHGWLQRTTSTIW